MLRLREFAEIRKTANIDFQNSSLIHLSINEQKFWLDKIEWAKYQVAKWKAQRLQKFGFTVRQKEEFVSRCIEMKRKQKNTLLAFVLTYPEQYEVTNPAKHLNKFLTGIKKIKRYDVNNYAWTMELTQKGQFHYHLITDMNWPQWQKINNTWESARETPESMNHGNGLTTKEGFKEILSMNGAASYASKYMLKSNPKFYNDATYEKIKSMAETEQINRIWGTSRGIGGYQKIHFTSRESKNFDYVHKFLEFNSSINEKTGEILRFQNDFCTSGYTNMKNLAQLRSLMLN